MAPNFPKKVAIFQRFDAAEDFVKLNAQFDEILRWIQNYVATGGGPDAVDHALLGHLTYATAGHTGFQPAGTYLTAETDPAFAAWLIATPPVMSETDPDFNAWLATDAFEPALGNPGVDGYVLSSTMAGVRSWIAAGEAETDPVVGAITGIVKANGAGVISAAEAGTDYEAALGNPGVTGYVLSSTDAGVRSWIAAGEAETDPIVGAITGIVMSDGAGNISAASPGTDYAAALGLDENYVTDAQLIVIGNTSNTNTGDQTLYATFGIDIDGAGMIPNTGSKGFITIPFNCTIQNWYLACDVSGDVTIDLKVSGTSIVGGGGNKPALTGAQSGNAAATSWTDDTVAAGAIIEFNLDSITTIKHVNLVLKVVKT